MSVNDIILSIRSSHTHRIPGTEISKVISRWPDWAIYSPFWIIVEMLVHDIQVEHICNVNSVTRLGDLLDFGQIFKAFGNN